MATQSSILAWETPWTEEHGGYSPQGHKIGGQDLVTKQQQQPSGLSSNGEVQTVA